MTTLLLLFFAFCLLTLVLISVQYRRRSQQQQIALDCRCQQVLLEFQPNLPRPVVRSFYGPDVSVPSLWLKRS